MKEGYYATGIGFHLVAQIALWFYLFNSMMGN